MLLHLPEKSFVKFGPARLCKPLQSLKVFCKSFASLLNDFCKKPCKNFLAKVNSSNKKGIHLPVRLGFLATL